MKKEYRNNKNRTSDLAHKKISELITKHSGEIKNVVDNASKKGYLFPHVNFSEDLNNYIENIQRKYLTKQKYYNKYLNLFLHGEFLFVFSPNKFRLLDVIKIDDEFKEEVIFLKSRKLKKNNLPKNK